MKYDELEKDKSMVDFIMKFIKHPLYPVLKDAYVAHTPNGDDKIESSVSVAYGKLKGTIFIFNDMERIAKTIKPEITKQPSGTGKDRDLEE